MPPSHETNRVTFQAHDRRTILYAILLEKLREETGTRWNLLRPLSDDLSPLQSHAQIEAGADDASDTILIYPLDAILEWRKMWNTLSQRRMIRKYFWADAISDSVCRRVTNMVYGLSDGMPACTILVFDAGPLDDRALSRIMKSFKKRHGPWARRIGFRGIWLVGSSPDHSCRLDSD